MSHFYDQQDDSAQIYGHGGDPLIERIVYVVIYQHKFMPNPACPMYCKHCGASDTATCSGGTSNNEHEYLCASCAESAPNKILLPPSVHASCKLTVCNRCKESF